MGKKGQLFFNNGTQTINIKGMMELENCQWILKLTVKVGWGMRYLHNLKSISLKLNIFDTLSWIGSWSGGRGADRSKGHC